MRSGELFAPRPLPNATFCITRAPCTCAAFFFCDLHALGRDFRPARLAAGRPPKGPTDTAPPFNRRRHQTHDHRSEEHTSELQSLMRISYAVFCLKKKKQNNQNQSKNTP